VVVVRDVLCRVKSAVRVRDEKKLPFAIVEHVVTWSSGYIRLALCQTDAGSKNK